MALSREAFAKRIHELLDELWPFALDYYHPLIDGRARTRQDVADWFSSFYIKDVGLTGRIREPVPLPPAVVERLRSVARPDAGSSL